MKLEVGMYVRTKWGVDKIRFISEVMCGLDETLSLTLEKEQEEVLKKEILKASHNIIDLIEVGDYVNGTKVTAIFEDKEKQIKLTSRGLFTQKYIKSIVTKEQFESMSYKVGV